MLNHWRNLNQNWCKCLQHFHRKLISFWRSWRHGGRAIDTLNSMACELLNGVELKFMRILNHIQAATCYVFKVTGAKIKVIDTFSGEGVPIDRYALISMPSAGIPIWNKDSSKQLTCTVLQFISLLLLQYTIRSPTMQYEFYHIAYYSIRCSE